MIFLFWGIISLGNHLEVHKLEFVKIMKTPGIEALLKLPKTENTPKTKKQGLTNDFL